MVRVTERRVQGNRPGVKLDAEMAKIARFAGVKTEGLGSHVAKAIKSGVATPVYLTSTLNSRWDGVPAGPGYSVGTHPVPGQGKDLLYARESKADGKTWVLPTSKWIEPQLDARHLAAADYRPHETSLEPLTMTVGATTYKVLRDTSDQLWALGANGKNYVLDKLDANTDPE